MAIYENPRRALICVRKSLIQGHFEWTLCTHWLLMLMLNLCSMFTWHWYKISRSQRHQLRITVSFFQPTIIISIFSAEDNNQDFPPPPIGLLLPPWSWWQRLASRLSHLQLLLEKLWLKSTFWWNYLRKGSSYLRSWDSAAPHCWKVKMSRVQGCTQSLAKLCNRQATNDNTAALTCIKNFLQ